MKKKERATRTLQFVVGEHGDMSVGMFPWNDKVEVILPEGLIPDDELNLEAFSKDFAKLLQHFCEDCYVMTPKEVQAEREAEDAMAREHEEGGDL